MLLIRRVLIVVFALVSPPVTTNESRTAKNVHFIDPSFPIEKPKHWQVIQDLFADINNLAKNNAVVNGLLSQNAAQLTQEQIRQYEGEWTATLRETGIKKRIAKRLSSRKLKNSILRDYRDVFTEVFLIDQQGALVSAYPLTSDYWQGDEDKWKLGFNHGECQIVIGKSHYDESADSKLIQVSWPVFRNNQKPYRCIGVLVVGIKVLYVETQVSP